MPSAQPAEPSDVHRLTTPPGGIMTDDVGAITGPVEVWLEGDSVRIRYEGALDAYTVTGDSAGRSLDDVVESLSVDPGIDGDGNPRANNLVEPSPSE